MGKKDKNSAKKKAARQEDKATEKTDRNLKRDLPAKLDAVLAKGQEETKDIDLFADPPPKEVCPICLHPHSLDGVCGKDSFVVESCCGHIICRGCIYASHLATEKINRRKKENKEPLLTHSCAFCREPVPTDFEENFVRFEKRMALDDDNSFFALAHMYESGRGIPKDRAKALDLFCRAAEVGGGKAYYSVGLYYKDGIVIEKSESKAMVCWKIAAKKGDIQARHNLGVFANNGGNHALAIRHLKIAAEAGFQMSLDVLKKYLQTKQLENGEFANILRKCLAVQAEMKTDQRDAWVKYEHMMGVSWRIE